RLTPRQVRRMQSISALLELTGGGALPPPPRPPRPPRPPGVNPGGPGRGRGNSPAGGGAASFVFPQIPGGGAILEDKSPAGMIGANRSTHTPMFFVPCSFSFRSSTAIIASRSAPSTEPQ